MWPGVSEPVEDAHLRVLSLGAGVQSTALALMAAEGEIGPMPDVAIFADTGWEPQAVYRHLDWLMSGVLPFPVRRVQSVDLRAQTIARIRGGPGRFASIPFHLEHGGIGRRQCTREAKIEPVQKEIRALLGVAPGQPATRYRVEQWIGISSDEIERMKAARPSWITNRWPLIEARMSRADCRSWMAWRGYPDPPRSSCVGCPFHNDAHWRALRAEDPAAFADAVEIDRAMRSGRPLRGLRHREFMHRARVPLDEVDLRGDAEAGQSSFLDECDGVCGT